MIRLTGVSKRYPSGEGYLTVLSDIHLSIQSGEFVSIMGPSGSGKSTLMHILGCLDVPSSGEYYLRGRAVSGLDSRELARIRNQEIGFVFQNFHLLPRMTALRNVELPLVYAGVPRRTRRLEAERRLAEVGLGDRLEHHPNMLSGGQKQRVAIARALVNHPSLLLADEPTGALDTRTGQEIMELFRALNRQGVTVVVITHDPEVASYAQRVIRLRDGHIVDGSAGGGGALEPAEGRTERHTEGGAQRRSGGGADRNTAPDGEEGRP
ncbi:MAG: ABC transporter ATP-binding protein [Alicyclobacillus sp.]|nr:ABC transporter ATP-binding protein [Alicyclobacillus sp.]